MYRQILIATDGSELANKAVVHGIALAKATQASVMIVTVSEMWSALDMARDMQDSQSTAGITNPVTEYEERASALAEKILKAAKQKADSQGVPCSVVYVSDQSPAEGIVATATEKGCDLIVIASHGRRGASRLLLGSRANEVVTHSKVPTLIVR